MKTNNNETEIRINSLTLKAIKGLLFNGNGTDLTSIIDDLSVGKTEAETELLAVNLGLTYKGLKPKIDESTMWRYDHGCHYYKYEYVGYSLIKGEVTYTKTYLKMGADGSETEICSDIINLPYGKRFETFDDVKQKVSQYYTKDVQK